MIRKPRIGAKDAEPRTIYIPGITFDEAGFKAWMRTAYPDFKGISLVVKEIRHFKRPEKPDDTYIMAAMKYIEADPSSPVTLRSRGAAIPRAIELANRLVENYGLTLVKVEVSQEKIEARKIPQIAIILNKTQK